MTPSEPTFEAAFERLEAILQQMQTQQPTLDESIVLYEEADKLINQCQEKLQGAEQKIEALIKNRQGQLALNDQQKPLVQEFSTKPQK